MKLQKLVSAPFGLEYRPGDSRDSPALILELETDNRSVKVVLDPAPAPGLVGTFLRVLAETVTPDATVSGNRAYEAISGWQGLDFDERGEVQEVMLSHMINARFIPLASLLQLAEEWTVLGSDVDKRCARELRRALGVADE